MFDDAYQSVTQYLRRGLVVSYSFDLISSISDIVE